MDSLDRTPVFALADAYVDDAAALDPVWATDAGVTGYDDQLTDYSPDGIEARASLCRQTLVELAGLSTPDRLEQLAAALLIERLDTELALIDAGEPLCDLNNIASPVQIIREVFDLMAYDTVEDWEVAGRRLAAVPEAVAGAVAAYEEGRRRGLTAARRQAMAAASQAAAWAGDGPDDPFFDDLVGQAASVAGVTPALQAELATAAAAATEAYAGLADYLRDTYAPDATESDAVGATRYQTLARSFLGAEIDLTEAYEWAWEELARIETDMAGECQRLRPGAGIAETVDWLEHESDLAVEGTDALRQWLQDLMDQAVSDLDGTYFDIAPPVRRVEAMIAPPGGAAAMYYTGPSEDFSRPGRTWYPPPSGQTRFPLWSEMSTAFHEGVPGHHLQVAQVVHQRAQLSRFARMTFISGHGEGWALYAERLMDEFGFLPRPEYRMGMLAAQAMRAVRVIIDMGMHLELEIPTSQPGPEPVFAPGERWTPDHGREFLRLRSRLPESFAASELVRYLGWPGQAISYKVGERVWLEARADAQARHGADFDLKAFHAYALDLGPLGLDQLRQQLLRY
jgi:uncharacterized protein (DUF885 family)